MAMRSAISNFIAAHNSFFFYSYHMNRVCTYSMSPSFRIGYSLLSAEGGMVSIEKDITSIYK